MANIYDEASSTTTFVEEPSVTSEQPVVEQQEQSIGGILGSRIGTTVEVAVSKIFMAG